MYAGGRSAGMGRSTSLTSGQSQPLVGIAVEIETRIKGPIVGGVQTNALGLAQGTQIHYTAAQGRIYRQVDGRLGVSTGIPKRLGRLRQENAIGDEAYSSLREDDSCRDHKRRGIRMQEGFAAHQPNRVDVAKELTDPMHIRLVPGEIRVLPRRQRAVVRAPPAIQVAVVREMQFEIRQLRLAEKIDGPADAPPHQTRRVRLDMVQHGRTGVDACNSEGLIPRR